MDMKEGYGHLGTCGLNLHRTMLYVYILSFFDLSGDTDVTYQDTTSRALSSVI